MCAFPGNANLPIGTFFVASLDTRLCGHDGEYGPFGAETIMKRPDFLGSEAKQSLVLWRWAGTRLHRRTASSPQ